MSMSSALRRRAAASAAATCLFVGLSLSLAPSASASARVQPCIWPSTGTNLQSYFGVSSSLVIPFGGCDSVPAGSPWSTPIVFYVARTWEHIPDGITPIASTPLGELTARLVRVKFFIDEGRPGAFTVERSASQITLATAPWREVYPADPDWLLVDIGTHITVRPLSVGQHTVRGEFEVNGPTCDGTVADVDLSCVPAGVLEYPSTRTFRVIANG